MTSSPASPSKALRALAYDIRTRLSITGMTPRWAVETDAIATQVEALEAERDALRAAVERVRALHAPIACGVHGGELECPICMDPDSNGHPDGHTLAPCPTIRALGEGGE